MKTINNNQQQENTKSKILAKLANLTAKISLKYDINFQEFFNLYKIALVKQAKKQRPKTSIVEIACRTGVDRRYIKQYLQSTEATSRTPKTKLVLNELKDICLKNDNNIIKKHGHFQSFESICNKLAYGSLTPVSIAKELIRQGKIEDLGNKYKLLEWRYVPNEQEDEQQLNHLTTELDHLTDTIIYNFNQTEKSDKQFQRNIYSTLIPPDKFPEVKQRVSKILEKSLNDVDKTLMKFETKVTTGTYPTFGVSMFVFGYENFSKPESETKK